ncbi:hypothetical protein ACFYNO_03130 [Kitasatospora sp. NPDC006697]|uniref:hypothetical protein n=1 Tax=Kitasatospora sp. NPDC006697 TaxID=3364020 RepID=UPI0036AD2529
MTRVENARNRISLRPKAVLFAAAAMAALLAVAGCGPEDGSGGAPAASVAAVSSAPAAAASTPEAASPSAASPSAASPSAEPSSAPPAAPTHTTAAPVPTRTAHSTPPAPAPVPTPAHTSQAPPAPQTPPAAAAGCTTDSKGNCIVRGRFCPKISYGGTGTDASGATLHCEDNNGWRWE